MSRVYGCVLVRIFQMTDQLVSLPEIIRLDTKPLSSFFISAILNRLEYVKKGEKIWIFLILESVY
nr:MAG TPA: hypothetical protein [Caudoviricetes sp.]